MKVLALNGLSMNASAILEGKNFEVITTRVAQEQLENYIIDNAIDALLVGNNNEIQQETIDACSSLKLIGSYNNNSNIDTQYASDNGIHIIQPTDGTANAIAELVFAHLFGMTRFLHQSNREMPLEGDMNFNLLRKNFADGTELRGKTLGIIGFDTIGKQVAKLALGAGMKVIATQNQANDNIINIEFYNGQFINIEVETDLAEEVIKQADFITIHSENSEDQILGTKQFEHMKQGVGIVNTSHSGAVDEIALVTAMEAKVVQYAGLDVFENQPTPEIQLLMNPDLSLTPNIAAKTIESQERTDIELANKIVSLLG